MTTSPSPLDGKVTVNGLALHYLEWGARDRPTMVLLHGLRNHAHCWDSFSAAISADYHVFAFDLRGRGESDWAADGVYTLDAYVEDLDGICRALALESITLVGHSLGGRIALAFTARHPGRVQQLVVVDVGPVRHPPGGERIRREILEMPDDVESFEAVVERLAPTNRYAAPEVFRRRLWYALRRLPNGRLGWRFDPLIVAPWRDAPPAVADLTPLLRSITCPVLVVRGAESDILSREIAQRMLDRLSRAQLATIERAGHMVYEDNPDAFLRVVRRFLTDR